MSIYTGDRDFLRTEGYPVLKELAQFYIDFLQLEADGKYHAFPSNQGEDGFTGNPEAYRDLPQIMTHTMRKCASVPRPAQDNWDDLAADYDAMSRETRSWDEVLASRGDFFPPEFLGFDGNIRKFGDERVPDYAAPDFYTRLWYAGKLPSVWMIELRNRCFKPERDWKYIRKMLAKWRTPNGLLRAMALPMYGQMGAYTETTGILAPIQDCLLEGHTDILTIFPQAPVSWQEAEFHQLRAVGGLLVSARMAADKVVQVAVKADAVGVTEVKIRNPFGTGKFSSSTVDASPVSISLTGRKENLASPPQECQVFFCSSPDTTANHSCVYNATGKIFGPVFNPPDKKMITILPERG